MTVIIHDTFTGAAGPLDGHAPDIAVGMTDEWAIDFGAGDLVLNGSGGVTFDGFSAASTYTLTGEFAIPLPLAMEFTMSGNVTNCQASMRLQDDTTGSDVFMDLRLDDSDGPVTGEFRTFVNFAGSGAGNIPAAPGPNKVRAEFYPDGLVKVWANDVELYHGDVNGGAISTAATYDRLVFRIQNPASPDVNVVDYLLVEALDANEVIYRDTFTGSSGTVVGHTPDVSPPSFGGYSSGLSLNGSGALVNTAGTGINYSEFAADIDVAYPFMVSFDVEPLNDGVQQVIDLQDSGSGDRIFIDYRYSNGNARVGINDGTTTSWFPGADFGITRARLRFEFYEDGTVKLYATGIFQEIKLVENAPPGLHYDLVRLGIDNAGAAGGNSPIYSASIENLPTGEAPPEGAPIPVIIHHLTTQGIL